MKRTFLIIAVTGTMMACNDSDSKNTTVVTSANSANATDPISDTANYTSIQWLDSTHQDLGKIKEGQTPEISWKFKNTGNKPLVIINAQGTCGCTVAEKPEQPIAPGGEGIIKAKFTSEGRIGPNTKQVMVTTNTSGNTTQTLGFSVIVEKK